MFLGVCCCQASFTTVRVLLLYVTELPVLLSTVRVWDVVGLNIAVSTTRTRPLPVWLTDVFAYCRALPPSASAAPVLPDPQAVVSAEKFTRYSPGASVTPVVPLAVILPPE